MKLGKTDIILRNAILSKQPNLTCSGLVMNIEEDPTYEAERQLLIDQEEQLIFTLDVLKKIDKIKSKPCHSSSVKLRIEHLYKNHIYKGVVILGALMCGFECKEVGTVDVVFNMSQKSWKRLKIPHGLI